MTNDPIFLVVDLFCGAGGTTTGFVQAELEGKGVAKVIACVNHDHKAIKSHWANHPEVKHFEEDIRTLDLTELTALVKYWRSVYPSAYLVLWASLECTNFSKAKGGQPRNADSRTLADHLDRYIHAINPDYVEIENVVEFMSWGPLDAKGKPVSRKNGSDWMRWRKEICALGYTDQWKELNSANYGAYTSRNRLFGCFAKEGLPIQWPAATHAKVPSKFSMHGDLKKWMPVKDVLNFDDEGESIFSRKKPLSEKTLERIYAGLIKFVAGGDTSFIQKFYSGRPEGKVIPTDGPAGTIATGGNQALVQAEFIVNHRGGDPKDKVHSVDGPMGSLTTIPAQGIVQADFLLKYNSMSQSGKHVPPSIDEPCPTIPCQGRLGLVQTEFLAAYYGNGDNVSSVDQPCPTVPTKDRFGMVQPKYWIERPFKSITQSSIEEPAGTLTTVPKIDLVKAAPFIVNPSHGGHSTSTQQPCPVIVARQDKATLSLLQFITGDAYIPVYDTDSETMIKIKQFMAVYGLVDIKMRMLRVHELLRIQGFPADYKMEGTKTDHKKFIGNSVVPQVVKAWTEAMAMRIIESLKKVA